MTATFAGLGLHADLVAVLARQGITEPFPIQELTIADALAGRDVLGKAKTGSGKTLAFGLPILERVGKAEPRRPTGLVLVPTRELANQVFGVLEPLGKLRGREVCAVYGGVGFEPQIEALKRGADIVVGTLAGHSSSSPRLRRGPRFDPPPPRSRGGHPVPIRRKRVTTQ